MAHGWACAELILLLRLFFEAAEETDPHIYLAAGVMPHWLEGGGAIGVSNAPTLFGGPFSYRLVHDAGAQRVMITVGSTHSCQFGPVINAVADARAAAIEGRAVRLPEPRVPRSPMPSEH